MFEVIVEEAAEEDLDELRTFDRRVIEDAMDEQLSNDPLVRTRNRKPLHSFMPAWEHVQPIWQLRVGDLRIFYDVDELRRPFTSDGSFRRARGPQET